MSGYTKGPWRLGTLDITPFGTGFSMGIDAASHGELATVVWQMEEDKIDGKPSLECEANARLIAQSPDLLKALEWALPLAKLAMEAHRMDRLKCGHNDIVGKYKSGQTWAGIYQSEIDEIEFADLVIAKAKGIAK